MAGFVLDVIILAKFGLGSLTDAYFVALTIPMIFVAIFRLQAEVLLPLFIHIREQEGEQEGWHFLNLIITASILLIIIIALFGFVFSKFIISFQAPGFDNRNIAMAIRLSRILFIIPIFLGPVAIMERVMNYFQEFFLPASLRLIEHLTKIVFVLALAKIIGIYSLIYGIVVGSILQLIIVYMSLRRKGYLYSFKLSFHNSKLAKAVKLVGYPTLGYSTGHAVSILENFLTSFLPSGSLSALRFAMRIVGALTRISVEGVATVILPMIAKNVAKKSLVDMKYSILKGITVLMSITIPLCAWFLTMSTPLVRLMFERNQFTSDDTIIVSHILILLTPTIFFSRFTSVVEAPFFAHLDTRTPFMAMFLQACLYAACSFILFFSFKVYSFPIARSFSLLLSTSFLFYQLTNRFGGLELTKLVEHGKKVILASLNMVILLIVGRWIIIQMSFTGLTYKIADLFLPTFFGGIVFLFAASYFKLIEMKHIFSMIVSWCTTKSRFPF